MSRLILRVTLLDAGRNVQEVLEQSIPATSHDLSLVLRRVGFQELFTRAMLNHCSITVESKQHNP